MSTLTLLTDFEIFQWRSMLIRQIMRGAAWLSIPVAFIISVFAFIRGFYFQIPVYIALSIILTVVARWRRVTDTVRMICFLSIMYLFILFDYITEGHGYLAATLLLTLPFSAALFFGMNGALAALALDLVTMVFFSLLYTFGILPEHQISSSLLTGWIGNAIIILLFGSFISLSLNYIIQRMTNQIRRSNELNRALTIERANLGVKVAERTEELRVANEELHGLVDRLSGFAHCIEIGEFNPPAIKDLVDRQDSIGQLARVFLDLGYEVSVREKRLHMLRVVIPAGVALTAERDFNRLLETIVVESQRLTNADGGSVYLVREKELEFLIARNSKLQIAFGGTTGQKSTFSSIPMYGPDGSPNLRSAAVWAAYNKKRLLVDDVYDETPDELDLSMVRAFDKQNNYLSKTMMVLPLIDSVGQVVGVLQLINARDAADNLIPFHPDDVLEALVLLGATALSSYWREEKLRAEIAELRIAIDKRLQEKQVSEVTDTDYFRNLQNKASEFRKGRKET